jgi:hypothetical protein
MKRKRKLNLDDEEDIKQHIPQMNGLTHRGQEDPHVLGSSQLVVVLPRMNDDAPWKRCFQFRPFGVDVVGAYEGGATAILQQLAPKRSEHTSITVGACKRLAFQSRSVALQTANSRMLRSRKALVSPLSLLPQLPGSES